MPDIDVGGGLKAGKNPLNSLNRCVLISSIHTHTVVSLFSSPYQIITVFSSNGSITTIPPVPFTSSSSFSPPNTDPDTPTPLRLPTPAEQGLCIGSVFTVTATNGVDVTRRLNVSGFCQSVEILHDTVQRQTMRRGGEIFKVQRELKHGIHETLSIALALPMLWGCPPEHERLRVGIESGGGIIDRIVHEWFIFNE